jgi:hypothetical protein
VGADGGIRADGTHGAWRARAVTLGLVGALLVSCVVEAEPWPLSSFRLFSGLRVAESWSLQLVAVDPGGAEHPIPVGRDQTAARSALHQLPDLHRLSLAGQRAQVLDWLELAGMDRDGYQAVRLYRRLLRRPTDADEPMQVVDRELRVEVPL